MVDCDVLQADGGAHTAAVTSGCVALALAAQRLDAAGSAALDTLRQPVAVVRVGLARGATQMDLGYRDDSQAEADLNLVVTGDGLLVEVQGTAEGQPFSRLTMDAMLDLAPEDVHRLLRPQETAFAGSNR